MSTIFAVTTMCAQNLKVDCTVYTEDGFNKGISLKVERFDGKETLSFENVRSHRLNLEVEQEYLLTYSKEGYVSKSIIIDSPDKLFKNRSIEFDVRLEKQPDDVYSEAYNYPVAYVHFDKLNNMLFETDYSTHQFADDVALQIGED